ncbi:MAG: hypothetical protein LBG52_03090 [Candidatus Peribacteria bacterium]|jgi:hypothetical protein|nr:hypothetical protein [Candidatus Peribacteria bacterium]
MTDTSLTPPTPASAPIANGTTPATTPAPSPAPLSSDPIKYLESLFDMMIKYDSSDIYLTF